MSSIVLLFVAILILVLLGTGYGYHSGNNLFLFGSSGIGVILVLCLLLLLMGYDRWSTGKIQPVTLSASLFLVVVQYGRILLGHTVVWQRFAAWVYAHSSIFHRLSACFLLRYPTR